MTTLVLALLALQDVALRVDSADPLHWSAELELGPQGARVDHVVDFAGSLSIWVSSESLDPRLVVEVAGRDGLFEDDNAGGGKVPWLLVQVEPGDALSIAVLAVDVAVGTVELRVVAAKETDATRGASARATEEIAEIERLKAGDVLEEARARVAALVDELASVPGVRTSHVVGEAQRRAGYVAYALAALAPADKAWAESHAILEWLLPEDHPDLLWAKHNSAVGRQALGDVAGALALYEAVHAAFERLLPEDHPDLLGAKQNLAGTRYTLGDLAGALVLYEAVHAARDRLLPEDHPDLLVAKQSLAVTRKALGDIAGAHALFEAVHAARERLLPPDHRDLLGAKLNLATTRKELGDLAGALTLEEAVHGARERLLPEDHPDLLRTKGNLAATRQALGDLAGALALREAVHAARERLLPPDHPDLLAAKQNLAATRKDLGDLAGAHALFEEVHVAREHLLPADHPDLLAAKANLAVTLKALGDLAGAFALEEAVHAAHEQLLPPDHSNLLAAKQNLAVTRKQLGDLAGALVLEEAVHAARERLLPPDHRNLLAAKQNLAVTREALGDLEGAHALFEAVHVARERLLPEDHPDLLRTKGNLANTRRALGDLAGALVLEEAVHAARERLLPPDHPDLLGAKQNLANTRQLIGDLAGALALDEAVHAARERLLPPDHPDLLATKLNLAATREALGDVEGAHALFEAVHVARERLLPEDHPDVLGAKHNLAVTSKALGDLGGALALEEAVYAARERLLPEDHPDLLRTKQNLAVTRQALGDLAGALTLKEAVHAVRQRLLPEDHPDVLGAKHNLAATRYALGDLAGALALARDIAASLASVAATAVVAAPREARATGGNAVHQLAEARIWGDSRGAALAEASFEVLETVRHAMSAPLFARLLNLHDGEAGGTRARLHQAEMELDRLVSSGPALPEQDDGLDPDASSLRREAARRTWREAIQSAALRRDRAQRELLALVEGNFVRRVTAGAVAQSLASGHVAVGITKLDRWRWDEERRAAVNDGPHYLAFVVLPGSGAPREVDLGPASKLEQRIDAWRAALGAPLEQSEVAAIARATNDDLSQRGVGIEGTSDANEVEAGRALRRALVDPLLAAAGNAGVGTELHICLDDALFTVPVDALPLDEPAEGDAALDLMAEPVPGDVPRLGDRYRVRFELSMARLIRPEADPETKPSLLAVGDVDFAASLDGEHLADAEPLYRLSSWGNWERLSATAAEVSDLEFQAKRHLGVEAQVLRGRDVTQTALADAVRGKRTVHLATHGWFLPRTERKSILDDEPYGASELHGSSRTLVGSSSMDGGSGSLLGGRATVTGFAPLTLCGLVLSGANNGTDEERSACLLTAQELAGFDLRACDLAVLSACETNVGIARAGQGIQSLQSALHMAGARTSITSLWAVRDWPTQSLMKRFYDNLWEKRMPKAEALWEAKRALRREGQPPYSWAGWVLAGDPD